MARQTNKYLNCLFYYYGYDALKLKKFIFIFIENNCIYIKRPPILKNIYNTYFLVVNFVVEY